MTEQDLPAFLETYRGLQAVLIHQRQSDGEARAMETQYFRALRPHPLAALQAAAEQLIARTTKFPKPVEWAAAVPKRTTADVRTMTASEAREYVRAVNARYQGEPCVCDACQRAGVTHRFTRFVPEFDAEDREERAFNPLLDKVVVCGHWAHGEELRRWYAARDRYYALKRQHEPKGMPTLPPYTKAAVRGTLEPSE